MNKKRLIIFPTVCFLAVIAIAVNIYVIFKNNYYLTICVDGISMQPTLNKEYSGIEIQSLYSVQKNVEFGQVDQSQRVIDNIKRYDIVTVYYPWDNKDYNQPYEHKSKPLKDADYKIKRVIALPNETFKIENNVISYLEDGSWREVSIPFERNLNESKNVPETTLGENEYWVMGDNYGHSNDSSFHNGGDMAPVYKENITGVLVSIEGYCVVKQNISTKKISLTDKHYYSKARIYK